jgi:hypothetical protein
MKLTLNPLKRKSEAVLGEFGEPKRRIQQVKENPPKSSKSRSFKVEVAKPYP